MRLGKGIPLTLPEVCNDKAPSKGDFAGIEFLKIEEETKDTFSNDKKDLEIGKKKMMFLKEGPTQKINNFIPNVDKRDINEFIPEVYIIELQ